MPANTVRAATVLDAPALAAIHRACWLDLVGADIPGLAEALEGRQAVVTWRNAVILAQGEGPYAMFAAVGEADGVAGFAALGPLLDQDGGARAAELVALWVAPQHQRAGHGSRLLAAVADALRAPSAPFDRLSHWALRQDVHRHRFLRGAGFGPDGAERTWRAPTGELMDEQRWSALLT
ncbi:MAG: GNAT family N-acetyltransferase [Bifidobacteriaceae bacterium]|nr:GNAT family N-acetyltransferase [Bifidobacteriaceae bacterium]